MCKAKELFHLLALTASLMCVLASTQFTAVLAGRTPLRAFYLAEPKGSACQQAASQLLTAFTEGESLRPPLPPIHSTRVLYTMLKHSQEFPHKDFCILSACTSFNYNTYI